MKKRAKYILPFILCALLFWMGSEQNTYSFEEPEIPGHVLIQIEGLVINNHLDFVCVQDTVLHYFENSMTKELSDLEIDWDMQLVSATEENQYLLRLRANVTYYNEAEINKWFASMFANSSLDFALDRENKDRFEGKINGRLSHPTHHADQVELHDLDLRIKLISPVLA